jgi:hypothetical protein
MRPWLILSADDRGTWAHDQPAASTRGEPAACGYGGLGQIAAHAGVVEALLD